MSKQREAMNRPASERAAIDAGWVPLDTFDVSALKMPQILRWIQGLGDEDLIRVPARDDGRLFVSNKAATRLYGESLEDWPLRALGWVPWTELTCAIMEGLSGHTIWRRIRALPEEMRCKALLGAHRTWWVSPDGVRELRGRPSHRHLRRMGWRKPSDLDGEPFESVSRKHISRLVGELPEEMRQRATRDDRGGASWWISPEAVQIMAERIAKSREAPPDGWVPILDLYAQIRSEIAVGTETIRGWLDAHGARDLAVTAMYKPTGRTRMYIPAELAQACREHFHARYKREPSDPDEEAVLAALSDGPLSYGAMRVESDSAVRGAVARLLIDGQVAIEERDGEVYAMLADR